MRKLKTHKPLPVCTTVSSNQEMARGKSTGGKEALKKQQFRRGTGTPRTWEPAAKVHCNSTPNFIQECARGLDGENLKRFEKSCFGHLIHFPRVMFCSHLVHNILLKRKDKEDEDALSFIIGGQEICFGEREFAMMSGLKFQGTDEIVQKPKEEIRLMKVYFPGKENVKLEDLVKEFRKMENNEDKLKLGLLASVEGMLKHHDSKMIVDKGRFLLADNLEEFNSYPWGKLFYKATRDSLIKASKKKDISKAKDTLGKVVYNLVGFPHVFQAWILESIPSLKQKYTVENKKCPQALQPRILHMEMLQSRNNAPSHEQIRADLSCADIEVLSTLQLTQEEVKESYMAGLLTEVDISGVQGLRYEDNSSEQREANHCSSPLPLIRSANLATTSSKRICVDQQKKKKKNSNSGRLKVDNRIGTATKEYTTLSNDADQDVRSLENLKLKLRNEINILHKQKSAVESDVRSLSKEREQYRFKLIEEKDIIHKVKSELGRDIDTLNQKKTKLGTDAELLNKEKEILQCDFDILCKEKTRVESDVELLSREKSEMETGVEFLKAEKNELNRDKILLGNDIELLTKDKTEMKTEIESLRNEKSNLRNETELLKKENMKLRSEFEILKGEKSAVQRDVCSLNEMKITVQGDICSLNEKKTMVQDDICSLNEKKTMVQDDICSLNEKKNTKQDAIRLLNDKKANLGKETELLNMEKTKLQTETDFLNKEKTELVADVALVKKRKSEMETGFGSLQDEKNKLRGEIESLNMEKAKLGTDFEVTNKEKVKLQNEVELLNDEKNKLQSDIKYLNREKAEFIDEFELLNKEKARLGKDVVFLKIGKKKVEIDSESLQDKKNKLYSDIESLNKEKAKLEIDFEVGNKDKVKLQNDIQLLSEEKDKLQSDIEYHNEEKDEFIRSVTADLNKSFYEREKTLAENEKMFKEKNQKNQILVANTEELQEARQDLIKVMQSEKATNNTVIGIVNRKRGGTELWNFGEKRRATLKEVISFQLNRTDNK